MVDREITAISNAHSLIGQQLKEEYFQNFVGSKKSRLELAVASLNDVSERLRRVQSALADPLWVVLLGRFSAGKSSLINAFFACFNGKSMRNTGLSPTDKQATVLLHESCNTGLLAGHAGVVQVEGISLIVQQHKEENLRPVLLVDTPGLLDDEGIDEALMEFVGHADVVLHCMTPDAQLVTADRNLLEKRRKYFPSQVYYVVVTKGDLHYRDKDGNFSESEWEKNLALLASRYAEFTKENLDLRPEAQTRTVMVVDSISGQNVKELLSRLLLLAEDCIGGVPRVREPVVRERLGYVCARTVDTVLDPVIALTQSFAEGADEAQELLAKERKAFETHILPPIQKILQLELRALKSELFPAEISKRAAARLGIESLLDTREQYRIGGPHFLNFLHAELLNEIRDWVENLNSLPVRRAIEARENTHNRNYRDSRKNMEKDAFPQYAKSFPRMLFGRRLQSLLRFQRIEDLPLDIEVEVSGRMGREDDGIHDREAERIEGSATLSIEGQKAILEQEAVKKSLDDCLSEGLDLIIANAKTDSETSVIVKLRGRACEELRRAAASYGEYANQFKARVKELDEQLQNTIARVNDTECAQVEDVAARLMQFFETCVNLVRGSLIENGLQVHLQDDDDAMWDEEKKCLDERTSTVLEKTFAGPLKVQLELLTTQIEKELRRLVEHFQELEKDIDDWIFPDVAELNEAKVKLKQAAKDWSSAFLDSVIDHAQRAWH